jgi:fatty acid-binding protein DegV
MGIWRRGCFADGANKNDKERLNARHASEIIKEAATHPTPAVAAYHTRPNAFSAEPYAILDAVSASA